MHEVNIDYIAYSHKAIEKAYESDDYKEINGFGFYTNGYQGKLGERTYFGNPNSKKAYTILSGVALHNMRVVGWNDSEVLKRVFEIKGEISRIDWSITDYIDESLVLVDDIVSACESGKVSGTLVNYGYKGISGADVGQPLGMETCYIGSPKRRGKNGIFRAYDKGMELGLEKYLITRLELEERGKNAQNSAKRAINGASIKSIMNSRLQFDHEPISKLYTSEPVDTSRGQQLIIESEEERMEKKWEWLMKQVVPTLREVVAYDRKSGNGDDRLMQLLYNAGIVSDKKESR